MRATGVMVLAAMIFAANAVAAAGAPGAAGPLSPGRPAGAKQAQMDSHDVVLYLGIAGLAAGAVLGLVANNEGAKAVVTTATTT